jgi:hypothetical protein
MPKSEILRGEATGRLQPGGAFLALLATALLIVHCLYFYALIRCYMGESAGMSSNDN